jgi:hypothetical protein
MYVLMESVCYFCLTLTKLELLTTFSESLPYQI